MVGAMAAALWLHRNFSPAQMLSIALLGVLIPDRWSILSSGFWLSFCAVALILYVTAYRLKPSRVLREGDGKAVGSPSAVSIPPNQTLVADCLSLAYPLRVLVEYGKVQWAMTIGLIPMLLALFQQISLVSPIANAFAIPLVSLVVVPLTLPGAALPQYLSYSGAPLWLAHTVMSWTMALLEWLNRLPQAVGHSMRHLPGASPPACWAYW